MFEHVEINGLSMGLDTPVTLASLRGTATNATTIYSTQVAGAVGATPSGYAVAPRALTLNGILRHPTHALRQSVIAAFPPARVSRLTVTEEGVGYFLDVVPAVAPLFDSNGKIQRFSVELTAPFPYWQTVEQETTQFANLSSEFSFPVFLTGEFYLSRTNESILRTITNDGNAPVGMTITFGAVADVVNPSVYHHGSRKRVGLLASLAAGDLYRITTGENKAVHRLEGGDWVNAFGALDPTSDLTVTLEPGDNVLGYYADSGRAGLVATIVAPQGVLYGL